jgi:hypothetical protein
MYLMLHYRPQLAFLPLHSTFESYNISPLQTIIIIIIIITRHVIYFTKHHDMKTYGKRRYSSVYS